MKYTNKIIIFFFVTSILFFSNHSFSGECSDDSLLNESLIISSNCETGTITSENSSSNSITIHNGITFTGRILNNPSSSLSIINNGNHINPDSGMFIDNFGILSIINSGIIGSSSDPAADGVINNQADGSLGKTITSITNSGSVLADDTAILNFGSSTRIGTINNSGTISARIFGIKNVGTITTITNTGTIKDTDQNGIRNLGTITTLHNTGTISGGAFGIMSSSGASTLTNLYNSQANLVYGGELPTNYQIIINSISDFGTISFSSPTGSMNFDIHSSSTITSGNTYQNVITGLDTSKLNNKSGTFTKDSKTHSWTLDNSESSSQWDLIFGDCTGSGCPAEEEEEGQEESNDPNATDTNTSMLILSSSIRTTFDLFTILSDMSNFNSYKCYAFKSESCVSLGTRHTNMTNNNADEAGLFGAFSHKLNDKLSIGGFFDQLTSIKSLSNVTLDKDSPMYGFNIRFNRRIYSNDLEFKLATSHMKKNISYQRTIFGSSEAGNGDTKINIENYFFKAAYNIRNSNYLFTPYIGKKLMHITQNKYTENNVNNPLTIEKHNFKSNTNFIGLKSTLKIRDVFLHANISLQKDDNLKFDDISFSGVSGVSPVVNLNYINKTRTNVDLGLHKRLFNNSLLSINFYHSELSSSKSDANTLHFLYSKEF